jgi:hypothetical protein
LDNIFFLGDGLMAYAQRDEMVRKRHIFRVVLHALLWMVAGAVLEFVVLAVIGIHDEHVTAQNDIRCNKDLVAMHAMFDDIFRKLSLDERNYPEIQSRITLMQNACADHNVKSAEAIGIDIAMALAFLTDGAETGHKFTKK